MSNIITLPNKFAKIENFGTATIKFAACNVGLDDANLIFDDYYALIAADTEIESPAQRRRKIELANLIQNTNYYEKDSDGIKGGLKYETVEDIFVGKYRFSAWNCQNIKLPEYDKVIEDGDLLKIIDLYDQQNIDVNPHADSIKFKQGYDIRPGDFIVAGMINGAGRNYPSGAHTAHHPENNFFVFNYVKLYRLNHVVKNEDGIFFNGRYLNDNGIDCVSPLLPIGHLLGALADIIKQQK